MVCIVTGSSRGLGRAVALAFGKNRWKVAVHFREQKKEAEETASGIDDSIVLQADVRDAGEVKSLVDDVIKKWGRIDILVNNAGITAASYLVNTAGEDFDVIVNTNLKGPFHFIRTVGRHMMKRKSGHIINVSSYVGVKGGKGLSAYAASKAGLIALTKTSARELSGYNVMVNAVLPGYMLTDMGAGAGDRAKDTALKENLVKDYSDPQRVAEFMCHLSETKGISGQVFNLDSRIL